jgi:cardiolipin synthase
LAAMAGKVEKVLSFACGVVLCLAVVLLVAFGTHFALGLFFDRAVAYFVLLSILSLAVALCDLSLRTKLFFVLCMAIFPYVGFGIVAFVFLEKAVYALKFRRKKNSKNGVEKPMKMLCEKSPQFAKVAKYVDYRTNFTVLFAEKVEFIDNPCDYLDSITRAVSLAKNYVLLEFYIAKSGLHFSKLMAELFSALGRNVRVELVVDYVGSSGLLNESAISVLKQQGAKVTVFKPPLGVIGFEFNVRTHRKIAVIDGKIGFLGGVNFRDESARPSKDGGFKFFGQTVFALENMFFRLDGRRKDVEFSEIDFGEGFVQPFSVSGAKTLEGVVLELIGAAKSEIVVATPYLSLSEEMLSAIRRAVFSGVKCKFLLPRKVSRAIWLINQSYAEELLKFGCEIYFYEPKFLHEKLVIVDGKCALSGSANFDVRSMEYQIESSVIFYDNRVIDELLLDFNIALGQSERATESSLGQKLAPTVFRRFLRLFSYFV